MTFTDITYEKQPGARLTGASDGEPYGAVGWITINRPAVRNAFRTQTVDDLIKAFRVAWDDTDVGVVVLTGAGDRAFCSGGDQKERSHAGYGAGGGIGMDVQGMHAVIRRIPKPVIAMVNGYAIGGGHVLHVLCAKVVVAEIELALDLIVDRARDRHAAGLGDLFEPRGDVHAVPEYVAIGGDHVAQIYADTKRHAALGRQCRVALGKLGLDLGAAAHRLDGAGKLGQYRIPGRADDAAASIDDTGVHGLAVLAQRCQGGLFVGAHEPAIALDVGGEDYRDLALMLVRSHCRCPPQV